MPADAFACSSTELAAYQARLRALMLTEPAKAREKFEEVYERAEQLQSTSMQVLALLNMAGCDFLTGHYPRQRDLSARAVEMSVESAAAGYLPRALNSLGLAEFRLGQFRQAYAHIEQSIAEAAEQRDVVGTCRGLGNMGMLMHAVGEIDTAMALHERALTMARSLGHHSLQADMLVSRAWDSFDLGMLGESLLQAKEALRYSRSCGLPRYECLARMVLADVLLALGRNEAAARAARCGQRVARWASDSESLASLLRAEALAEAALGEDQHARTLIDEAIATDSASGHILGQYRSYLAQQQICASLGDSVGEQAAANAAASLASADAPELTRPTAAEIGVRPHVTEYLDELVDTWLGEVLQATERRVSVDEVFSHHLAHDPYTGAITRQEFQVKLQQHLDLLGPDELIGVVFIGFDRFQPLEEVLGQTLSTDVLAQAVTRVLSTIRSGDCVARVSDNVFGVGLDHIAHRDDISLVIDKILSELQQPFFTKGQTVYLEPVASGILAPGEGDSADTLFERVELALRSSQGQPATTMQPWAGPTGAPNTPHQSLSIGLRRALTNGEFEVFYQGQFGLEHGALQGFEALVRWRHPEYGTISPARFIPIAEETRQMLALGDWVMRQACQQAREWDLNARGMWMAVNVSPIQFTQPDFVTGIRAAINSAGIPPEVLMVEVTESLMMNDPELAQSHSHRLKDLGVRLALDDFGAGFSNFAILQDIPFDVLKIDRSLLTNLDAHGAAASRSSSLLRTMVNMAKELELHTIAEGVETGEQLSALRGLGFDSAQGYWLSRPGSASKCGGLLGDVFATA